jgi:hypothetical protein
MSSLYVEQLAVKAVIFDIRQKWIVEYIIGMLKAGKLGLQECVALR